MQKQRTDIQLICILLRIAESLKMNDSELKKVIYNKILSELKFKRLKAYIKKPDWEISEEIIQEVRKKRNLPDNFNTVKYRKREFVEGRMMAMALIRCNTKKYSLTQIASHFLDKNHATILHAYKVVDQLRDTDKRFKEDMDEIKTILKLNYEPYKKNPK